MLNSNFLKTTTIDFRGIKHNETRGTITRLESELLIEDVKDKLEEVLGVSDSTDEDLQKETRGPFIFKDSRNLIKHDGYGVLLGGYIPSISQNFDSYLRTEFDLVKDDIKLILKQLKLNICTLKNIHGFRRLGILKKILAKYGKEWSI